MTPDTLIFAADPGRHGALAVGTAAGEVLLLCDLPFDTDEQLDAPALRAQLDPLPRGQGALYIIEKPVALPGLPAYSAIRLGACYGALRAVLSGYATPAGDPTPSVWKRAIGLTREKSVSVELARRLFENLPTRLRHDKCEALLLLAYLSGAAPRQVRAKPRAKPPARPRKRRAP
jgi:hypothetical protein